VHKLRLVGRELGGDEPAQRVTDQIDVPKAHGREPAAEPRRELGGAQLRSQPREVEHVDESPSSDPQTYLRPPAPGTGKTMHEHHRRARPRDPVPDALSVDLYLSELHVNQCVSSGSRRHPSAGLPDGPGARLARKVERTLQWFGSRQGDEQRARERIAGAEGRASLDRIRSSTY
jgi:hypothetical protein